VDDFIHGNLSHHIILQRSSTLGRGEPYCDFFLPVKELKKDEFLNDAVNNPVRSDWSGKAVGSEAEDLSRNDKWLCPI
jgi:hypothetical protein